MHTHAMIIPKITSVLIHWICIKTVPTLVTYIIEYSVLATDVLSYDYLCVQTSRSAI